MTTMGIDTERLRNDALFLEELIRLARKEPDHPAVITQAGWNKKKLATPSRHPRVRVKLRRVAMKFQVAELNEARKAYLLAILCSNNEMVHPSYISEKLDFAFAVNSIESLMSGLDPFNQSRMLDLLELEPTE